MFAFASYHASSRKIPLARDPLGIKPLYVASEQGRFVFSSEIRPMLAAGLVSADLDLAGIAGMLAYGAVQSPRAVYQHIQSFPAGHTQWVTWEVLGDETPRPPRRTWNFPRHLIADDEPQAVATIHDMLRDAVVRHLVADVPVGVFLSAGIDSTLIASFAREYTPQVTAFTVGFGPIHGESEQALPAYRASPVRRSICTELLRAVQTGASPRPRKPGRLTNALFFWTLSFALAQRLRLVVGISQRAPFRFRCHDS